MSAQGRVHPEASREQAEEHGQQGVSGGGTRPALLMPQHAISLTLNPVFLLAPALQFTELCRTYYKKGETGSPSADSDYNLDMGPMEAAFSGTRVWVKHFKDHPIWGLPIHYCECAAMDTASMCVCSLHRVQGVHSMYAYAHSAHKD